MATYIVVDKDKDPLEPGEIQAGGTILVNDGDVFIFDSTANSSTNFEAASGGSTNFAIQFNESNSNDFNVVIKDDLNASISISDDVNIEDIDIDAKDADSVSLTAGNNVTVGKYDGSETGADTLVFGNDFTAVEDIKTFGGDDEITIGDNATLEKDIETGDGDDTITIGDGLVAEKIKTGKGNDSVTIGDDATIDDNIETGDGDDTITIGDGLVADDIKTGKGNDAVTIGDDAVVDDINTEDGDDTVTLGDNFEGDKLETKDGDDLVIIGSGATIEDLDGGKDDDKLVSETDFPDASNFETVVCFVEGTLIRTERGNVPVEALTEGDRVITMDNGVQPIRWIGSSEVCGKGRLAPVCIAEGLLGNRRDLWVSQQHRMLFTGWQSELYFGERQVLVPAKHLVDGAKIRIVEVETVNYFHMLFDRHEIVFAENTASESLYPGDVGLGALCQSAREEIFQIFPNLRLHPDCSRETARPTVKSFEGRLLAA